MLINQVRRFGEALVERHVLSRDSLESAIEEAERTDQPLPNVLLKLGLVGPKDLTAALADQLGLPFIDFLETPIHQEAPTLLTSDLARRWMALPVDFEDHKLIVAFAEPADDEALAAVGAATTYEIIAAVADREELSSAIDMIYGAAPKSETGGGGAGLFEGSHGDDLHINDLLELVINWRGSDLHLASGSPPVIRVNGDLRPIPDVPVLNGSQIRQMVYSILTQKQREKFEKELELDTSYALPGKGRFRVNVFLQRDSVGAVMRAIPFEVIDYDILGVPPAVKTWAYLPRGLVLITGPTGSGKSTTLASLIDIVNRERSVHIMTVEDPIEFLHSHKRSLINQREVGEDTHSFAQALKHVLRQDPDVILVGEMRDLETISTALTAAETGHLVFATLHTQDAPQSIDRVIDVFPAHSQQQVRVQLASALQGIVTQQLVPTIDG
ncbi:MAG TPA: PilT/PilU family type 4a pilus ATPase, partial [Acidimicrobiia bacterium]|nr:PilT/PilU family type 4a pilus ATPase [Acidimicrobiia bacterium]